MSTIQGNRPVTITIIGVLAFVAGVLDLVAGVIMIFLLPVQEAVDALGGTGPLMVAAIGSIIVGLITVGIAGGLLRGSQGARLVITVLQVFSIIGSLFLAVLYINDASVVGEWLGLAVSIVLLMLLWTRKATAFFEADRR